MKNETIDMVRQRGVKRGINASIETLEALRDQTEKNSHQWVAVSICINQLRSLTVEKAEDM